jgi:hypothetical protein
MNTVEYLVEIADTEGDAAALEMLRKICADPNEMARFRSRRIYQMDMKHNLLVASDERALSIAKNLLLAGDPIDKIVSVTGLTREEVEGMRVID